MLFEQKMRYNEKEWQIILNIFLREGGVFRAAVAVKESVQREIAMATRKRVIH